MSNGSCQLSVVSLVTLLALAGCAAPQRSPVPAPAPPPVPPPSPGQVARHAWTLSSHADFLRCMVDPSGGCFIYDGGTSDLDWRITLRDWSVWVNRHSRWIDAR